MRKKTDTPISRRAVYIPTPVRVLGVSPETKATWTPPR